jgi:hypothetical protein
LPASLFAADAFAVDELKEDEASVVEEKSEPRFEETLADYQPPKRYVKEERKETAKAPKVMIMVSVASPSSVHIPPYLAVFGDAPLLLPPSLPCACLHSVHDMRMVCLFHYEGGIFFIGTGEHLAAFWLIARSVEDGQRKSIDVS